MAASLLRTLGLEELMTTTSDDYRALAIKLGRDAEMRAVMRKKLMANQMTSALFDTTTFTRHLEAAYVQMGQRSIKQLPPENLIL